jgi:hypothetical protein
MGFIHGTTEFYFGVSPPRVLKTPVEQSMREASPKNRQRLDQRFRFSG